MTINYEQTREAMQRIVNEKGRDYVYPGAAYGTNLYADDEGNPSCLVGHVVYELDPEGFEDLSQSEGAAVSRNLLPSFDGEALDLLAVAQGRQDNGTPWGEAYEHAVIAHDRAVSA